MAKKVRKVVGEGYVGKAQLSSVRLSPQKARLVADLIRGKSVNKAIEALSFCDKKSAPIIKRLLLSAVANVNQNSDERNRVQIDELKVKRIWVDGGPVIKRFMPRAQGRATPIRKRTSSITLLLDEV